MRNIVSRLIYTVFGPFYVRLDLFIFVKFGAKRAYKPQKCNQEAKFFNYLKVSHEKKTRFI